MENNNSKTIADNGLNNGFFKNLLRKKTPDEIMENANKVNLKRTLNAFDLIMLGIGAVIGSGIFTIVGVAMVGEQSGYGAGPVRYNLNDNCNVCIFIFNSLLF